MHTLILTACRDYADAIRACVAQTLPSRGHVTVTGGTSDAWEHLARYAVDLLVVVAPGDDLLDDAQLIDLVGAISRRFPGTAVVVIDDAGAMATTAVRAGAQAVYPRDVMGHEQLLARCLLQAVERQRLRWSAWRAREAARHHSLRLAELIHNQSAPVAVLDHEGSVLFANRAAELRWRARAGQAAPELLRQPMGEGGTNNWRVGDILWDGRPAFAVYARALGRGESARSGGDSEHAAKHEPAASIRARPHLLLVDDERDVVRALQRVLRRYYRVTTAHGGREAIALLEGGSAFDAVLCDVQMPDIDGIEVYRWLSEHRPEVADRTLLCTGGVMGEEATRFVDTLAERTVAKTAGLEALRRAIDTLVEGASADVRELAPDAPTMPRHSFVRTRMATPLPGAQGVGSLS